SFRCFRYDEADPESLPSDMVLHLFEDKMGRIWISNPEALGVYLEDGRFRTFGKADDLPFALCYGVFADVQKRLWAAFGGNFTQFSLEEDGRFVIHKVITRNDGLAGAANAQYGWSLLPDGRLALSQRYGLNLLHPDSVTVSPSFPPVLLTDFRLFNQPVGPGATAGNENTVDFRLPHDINRLDRVELPPHHDFISLEFSGREFRPGEATYYAYRMVGLQEEWQDLEERNFLSFPKLPPGDYRLELRTGNSLLQWSDDVRTLDISLAAPWYRRWWALLLFGLLGAGAVYLLGRERERQRQRVEAARVAERENFRRRSARDFHDEAGNHLSRVSLLTELARRQVPGEEQGAVAALLSDINANVQVIREGMRDFIWALDPDNDNAYELALRLKRFGQDLFTHHPAEFSAAVISDGLRDITLRADQRRHLILLCKEAMHNSFKHAAGASKVHFSLTADRRELRLRWKDDGPGYDPVVASDGSGLKNMRTRAEKIGASLRVDSRNGNDLRVDLRY
ncbi:MAG: triple tyrosine motif-containing protein, partial [Bacteroidota bacterium]